VHFGVYSPIVFLLILASLGCGWAAARTERTPRFLLCFGLPLLIMYGLLSFNRSGEANWTSPGMVTLGMLAVHTWLPRAQAGGWARKLVVAAPIVAIFMSALVLNTDIVRSVGVPWLYKKDPGGRLRAWSATAKGLEEVRAAVETRIGQPVFLITNKYQTAAELAFYFRDKKGFYPGYPPVFIPESQAIQNQFSFWPRYDGFIEVDETDREALGLTDVVFTEQDGINPFMGCSALYITDYPEDDPITPIANGFVSNERIGELRVYRRGLLVRSFRIFLCHSYETLPL